MKEEEIGEHVLRWGLEKILHSFQIPQLGQMMISK
jgi:hypothetical protein